MKAQQKNAIKEQLLSRQSEIQGDLDRLHQEMASLGTEQEQERGGSGNHLADDGSSVMEQERLGTLIEDMGAMIRQISGAVTRLENGTYGTCQRCGKEINPERLEAFPYVEYCIECQSALERERQLYGSTVRAS